MDLDQLHFAHPLWLWLGGFIPLAAAAYFFFYRPQSDAARIEKHIDSHLLPYLLVSGANKKNSARKTLLLWSTVWLCLTMALAGPRWTYQEIETFSKDQSLVILLDLSESMNAADARPTRLVRAKQKIEDILAESKGVKVGLIAFAADPHMISPLTDDKDTVRHLLPSLTTNLVYVQGSRLSTAVDMASRMLNAEPGNNKSLLVISDGGFEDASAMTTVKNLAEKGVVIHAMGIGTVQGAPIQDHDGNVIKKNGVPLISKLEKEKLLEISRIGKGHYLEAHHADESEKVILEDLGKRAAAQLEMGKKSRIWDDRFYLLLFPILPLILWWYRRGYIFALVIFSLSLSSFELEASGEAYFKNADQRGLEALEKGDYQSATELFQDSYRKGVACYKAGNFAEAEKLFGQSSREEVAMSAAYNLGNALVQQQKLEEAITAYEEVLRKWPEHTNAKENLELVRKMLEQQKQESSQSESPEKNNNEENHNENEENTQSQKSDGSKGSQDNNKKENQNNSQDEKPEQPAEADQQDLQKEQDKSEQEKQEEVAENATASNEQSNAQKPEQPEKERKEAGVGKTQADIDADQWLNRVTNDPTKFMQNKFYLESKRNGTVEGIDPW